MREGKINANELLEIPNIKKMLPNLEGKTILDIGCGEGGMSRYFVKKGASKVVAFDISTNMINEAKKHNCKNIEYMVLSMEDLSKIRTKFDIVFSSLAFHYVKDFGKLMNDISNLLKIGGFLIFSQEHPIVLSTILKEDMKKYTEIGDKRYFYLSDYNNQSKRLVNWNVKGVVKYHRNFETIINTIVNSNMKIIEIKEPVASKRAIALVPKYVYQKDRPFFLFVKAQKTKG